jgi:transposase
MAATSRSPTPPPSPSSIRKVRERAAGADIGAEEHWICVDPSLTDQPIRRFGAFTVDLAEAVEWCVSLGVTSMAMEATGIYWRALYLAMEAAGIEVMLVDPRRTRNPRGRKTDMQDCRWIWELHAHGLLDGAYVPSPVVQELRTYLRFRKARIERASIALKEVQRALSMMNLKLQHVIADIGGATGQAIIAAILGGERDARALATHRDYRCTASPETLVKALTGTWRPEHLFLLAQAHADYHQQLAAIATCDRALNDLIAQLPQRSPDDGDDLPPKRPTGKHDFGFDAQQACYRLTGVDLAAIDGIGPNTALSFLGEVGFDLTPWSTGKAFCSWLGLCPNPKRSGGRHHGNLPTVANRAAQMLKDAAMGLRGNKANPLSKYYAKIAVRRGSAQALKAVAHKLARIIYALFTQRTAYDRTKLNPPPSERRTARLLNRLTREAGNLGYTLQKAVAQTVAPTSPTSC